LLRLRPFLSPHQHPFLLLRQHLLLRLHTVQIVLPHMPQNQLPHQYQPPIAPLQHLFQLQQPLRRQLPQVSKLLQMLEPLPSLRHPQRKLL
jgi:hypothetical protein